ncbi:TetR/AcrR family transcriptional regulator [Sphingomonas elodea]|uniref:TetR/AcrR family transcriptional regulator n=1 Tax=Sphingomonas elodea TaxID=179878 RepID=UPI0002630A7F|nr:TetR/AcrR family transcriptional regulator [Sphingomonas elodea]
MTGLRERKKDKLRADLLGAALDLFARQGFAETTIHQIADSVDVSPRTFLRYFATKEDVVVSWVEESTAVFLTSFLERPAGEAPDAALLASARAMLVHYTAKAEFYLTIERAIASSSAIRARKLEMTSTLAEQVTAALAQRTPKADPLQLALYPAVVFAMLRTVIGVWVESEGTRPLLDLFEQAAALVTFRPVSG